MKINTPKSRALSFKTERVNVPLSCTLNNHKVQEGRGCKYRGIIIRSDLKWADQVNCTVQKAWRALEFVMRVVKKGNKNTNILATNHWYGRYSNVERHAGNFIGMVR